MLRIDRKLVFLDIEATSLDVLSARPWEIGMIERWPDGRERATLLHIRKVSLRDANPRSLEVGRFHQRHRAVPNAMVLDEHLAAEWVYRRTCEEPGLGRPLLVGSAVGTYDAPILAAMLARAGKQVPWHHHPIDLVTWTQAHLVARGVDVSLLEHKTYELSELAGAPRPRADLAHTAMGDALWARAWWDALSEVTV